MHKNFFIAIVIFSFLGIGYYLYAYVTQPKGGIEDGKFRRKSSGITIYENEKKIKELSNSEIKSFLEILESFEWEKGTQEKNMDEKYNIMIDFNNVGDTKLYLSREIPNKAYLKDKTVRHTISDDIYNTVLNYIDN